MCSRKAMGFAVFRTPPTSRQVQEFPERAFGAAGMRSRHLVTDRGTQFDCGPFREWCERQKIRSRYGALGKYGSIAVIERFNRTLKHEGPCQDRSAPLGPAGHHHDSRPEMAGWERGVPHAARTVLINEVYFDRAPAVEKPRWEPRARWSRTSGCAAPYVPVRGECGTRLELEVSYLEGRRHLAVFRLREVA